MQQNVPIVTIDGLSSVGKTSLALQLSLDLGWNVQCSGMFYRFLAYQKLKCRYAMEGNYLFDDSIVDALSKLVCRVNHIGDIICLLGNDNLSDMVYCKKVERMAIELSRISMVFEQLLSVHRSLVKSPGLIAEGQKMAREIFPTADLCIYLCADEEVRIQRRLMQLNRFGNDAKIEEVALTQSIMDARALSQRSWRQEQGGKFVVIDTSKLSMANVKAQIYGILRSRGIIINQPTECAVAL